MSKSGLLPIEQRVQQFLKEIFSGTESLSLVIGVSGGADSMCLLHILNKLGVKLYAVHINYQKRDEESDKDARLVEQVAGDLGIDCETVVVDPDEAGNKNFQQWARQIRYQAFELKVKEVGADGTTTAHHMDDQIETILQKLFRGSGLISWSAMQAWDGRLFRPLIEVTREKIEIYCRENDIPFRTDASNLNSDYARNFLRNDWIPQMEQHFPGWQTNVLRIAEQADIFESSVDYIFSDITDEKDRINRQKFLQLKNNLQKAVLLYYIKQVDESQKISRDALGELEKLADLQTGKSIQLTETLELMRDRDFFKLVLETGDACLHLILEKARIEQKEFSFNGLEFAATPFENPDFRHNLYLDLDTLQWPICLRRWQEGDRFQPFGMEGHQTVADHLANRKVSAVEKEKALVIESFDKTICAVIFPPIENRVPPGTISELVRCDPSTRKCLTITRIS